MKGILWLYILLPLIFLVWELGSVADFVDLFGGDTTWQSSFKQWVFIPSLTAEILCLVDESMHMQISFKFKLSSSHGLNYCCVCGEIPTFPCFLRVLFYSALSPFPRYLLTFFLGKLLCSQNPSQQNESNNQALIHVFPFSPIIVDIYWAFTMWGILY